MAEHNCENCGFRAKYDAKPKSFLGRLWRFHIRFCPGWKKYVNSLTQEEQMTVFETYNIKIRK